LSVVVLPINENNHLNTLRFPLSSIVKLRSRLWRVDNKQSDIFVATSINVTPVERRKFYLPFEKVRPGKIETPSSNIVGSYSALLIGFVSLL
jgi:hypothetical protein